MRSILTLGLGSLLTLAPSAAWATHAMPPLNLVQESNGSPLAVGGTVAWGDPVEIIADSDDGTAGAPPDYFLQIEIRDVNAAFTGVPTHTSPGLNKPLYQPYTYAPTVITGLAPGSYKWQVREEHDGTLSTWVPFNGGGAAFQVVPPPIPDILVDEVSLSSVDSQPANDSLSFVVDAVFQNRGTVETGAFTWKAWLSTDTVLQPGTDTLLYTSTAPISVPATSTLPDFSQQVVLSPRPPPGAYYVLVEADPAPQGCTTSCGTVSEFEESNNVGSMENYFVNGVDLVATSISNGPANAQPGDSFTLDLKFFNQGVDDVDTPVEFRIVATDDAFVSPDDYEVYRTAMTVGGAQNIELTVPITLPPGITGGPVQWGLQLDPPGPNGVPANPVAEALESNNTALSAAQTLVKQANLQADFADMVDVVTGLPTRIGDLGEPARFQVRTTNVGDFPAIPFQVGVLLSKDNHPTLVADHLFADVEVLGLQTGSNNTTTYDITVTLPTVDRTGALLTTADYYFFLILDSFNVMDEVDEGNNMKLVQGPVRLRTPAADYSVVRVQVPAVAAAGEAFALSRIIKNVGTDDGAQVVYACYASANADIRPSDFPLRFINADGTSTPTRTLQLQRGESDDATEWVRAPSTLAAGAYHVGCLVDPGEQVFELSEENNAFTPPAPTQFSGQDFRIVTAQLPDAIIDVPYHFQLAASGAAGPVTWQLVDQPPEGLTLDQSSGTLTGTPAALGIHTLQVEASDGSAVAERVLTLRVLPPTTELLITTDALPPMIANPQIAYQAALSATGGTQPYRWSILDGELPGGLLLDTHTGEISGSPRVGTPIGETRFTVQVQSSLGSVATKEVTLRTVPSGALAITSVGMPDGMVGEEYLTDLTAAIAGMPTNARPLQWTVVSGSFPEGLTLKTHANQETGLVTGTPTRAGTWAFTVQVVDADGRSDAIDFVVRIHPNTVKVTLEAPPPAAVHPGDALDLTVLASSEGATFRLFSGALPPGITLDEEGKISGTVEAEDSLGTWTFTVEAKDLRGAKGLGAFSVEVTPVPVEEGCSATGGGLSLFALLAMAALLRFGRRRQVRVRA